MSAQDLSLCLYGIGMVSLIVKKFCCFSNVSF